MHVDVVKVHAPEQRDNAQCDIIVVEHISLLESRHAGHSSCTGTRANKKGTRPLRFVMGCLWVWPHVRRPRTCGMPQTPPGIHATSMPLPGSHAHAAWCSSSGYRSVSESAPPHRSLGQAAGPRLRSTLRARGGGGGAARGLLFESAALPARPWPHAHHDAHCHHDTGQQQQSHPVKGHAPGMR